LSHSAIQIIWVSAVGNSLLSSAIRLWIPSPIGFIASECFYDNLQLKFVVFENVSMLKRIEARAFSKTTLRSVDIPGSVEVLGESCILECGLLSSVMIESDSKLSRIAKQTFSGTGLVEIEIPASIEILSEDCFSKCRSLSEVRFES
jgi:hypothetical protein